MARLATRRSAWTSFPQQPSAHRGGNHGRTRCASWSTGSGPARSAAVSSRDDGGVGLTAPMVAQVLASAGLAQAQPKTTFTRTRRGGGGLLKVLWWQRSEERRV